MPALLAAALVFGTSGAVLVLEILAARLLAPYVGVTLETYTAIIGTVLAGISIGHALGGRAADRADPHTLLGPLLVAGGALSLATIPLVRFVGSAGGADESRAVLLAGVGFFLPAAVLSAVSPVVVKTQLQDLAVTGSVVGRLSAVGTAGSIVGTFLAGFVLVEVAATSTSIVVTGTLLVAAGVAAWGWGRTRRVGALGALLLLAGAGTVTTFALDERCDAETTYHCARIEADRARAGGRTLVLDTLRHSYVDLDDPTHLEFRYVGNVADVIDALAPAGPIRAVHVGGGGFTLPRYVAATRPGSTNIVLEIDGGLVDVATDRLGLTAEPGLDVREGDGRRLLADVPDASIDVVVGDAFGGLAVPWHLTTVEAVEEVGRVLRPGGLYVANLIDHPPLRFVRAELATLAVAFPHVALLAPPSTIDGRDGGNVVVVGSTAPIERSAVTAGLARRGTGETVLVDDEAMAFAGDAPVLTDDKAPVDQWLARSRR
ncbi:MAG TPA: fused MFS/spermidine synthase [Acidimicrobiales bacterium]|nr:fused MFS/spermidine synthase [Acidimicrobiales bacterium]